MILLILLFIVIDSSIISCKVYKPDGTLTKNAIHYKKIHPYGYYSNLKYHQYDTTSKH